MDKFINFCAGADISSLPGSPINALLINAFSNFRTDGEKERVEQLIDTAQPEWLILDSGGYQLKDAEEEIEKGNEITILMDKNKPMQPHKGIINLTPEHVVEAAVHVKPQIMIALDFPVKDLKDSPEEREREFRAKLGFNALWAIESSKLVEAAKSRGDLNDVKLLLPIQCYTLEQFNRYWQFIHSEGDIQFDGFSMPLRNLSLREAALFLIAFHKKSKKRMVHFLGEGNFSAIAFAAYLSKLDLFDWVSVDATSWREFAEVEHYMDHRDLSLIDVSEHLSEDAFIGASMENTCGCFWCRRKPFDYIKNMPRQPEKTTFLGCHNYWVTENFGKKIAENDAIKTPWDLKKYLRQRSDRTDDIETVYNALDFLEAHLHEDISYLEKMM